MNPEDAGILEAMLLGDRKNMEETDKHLFQIMGISHILAVSGLHIAVFGWGLFKILRRMRCSVKNAGLVSCAGIFFYGGMTGNSAAAVRAAVMFAMSVGALASGRTYDFLSAVSLAAILILVQRPLYLYDSGFLLSFGAVLGLGMVCPDLFPKEEIRKEGFLQKSLHGGISVWLTTLPVTLYFFFEIPVFGILINILVLPLAGLLLGAGALGGLLGMFLPAVFGKTAAYPAIFLLRIFRKAGELLSRLPWAMWSFGKPALWKCGMYYVFLCAALIWKGKYPRCFKRMVILAGMLVLFLKLPRKGMEVTFLDVGQGDCACIQTEAGSCFLVDGGSLDVPKVGKYRILPFLKASGIGTVEGVFISHMDEDHVNGIRELLEMIINRETGLKINRLFLSLCSETEKDRKELEKLGKRAGCEIVHVEKGTVLREKETVMECLSPSGAFSDSNAGSQVLLVSDRSFHILFTGDVEGQGEAELTKTLKRKGKTGIDVLKIAHHGSKNSTGEAFLQQAKPAAAVISCGKENRYGHPHRELLERLEKEKIHIVKTPDCGAICVSAFRKKVQISFQYRRIMVQ